MRITERKTGGPLETIPISGNLNFAHATPIYGRREYIYTHAQLKLYAYGKKRNNFLKRNVDESEKIE